MVLVTPVAIDEVLLAVEGPALLQLERIREPIKRIITATST
jgi:hypothetical protein